VPYCVRERVSTDGNGVAPLTDNPITPVGAGMSGPTVEVGDGDGVGVGDGVEFEPELQPKRAPTSRVAKSPRTRRNAFLRKRRG
jgi:hypothetical protein